MGGAAVAKDVPVTDAPDMVLEQDSAESWGPSLGYGVRFGPSSSRSLFFAARVEGFVVTEKERGGGGLSGAGYLGVQLGSILAELGLAVGALGLGSFEEGSDVVPAFGGGLHFGFPLGKSLRAWLIRIDATAPILPADTDLAFGFFAGFGVEWTPEELRPPEPGLVD